MREYLYPCESQTTCHPIEIYLPKGKYVFELWGAQGGNLTHAEGGFGGYTRGTITFDAKKQIFLYIGAAGFGGMHKGFTNNAYNGGGYGTHYNSEATSCSGGGATDVRTSTDISSRILVAGDGGGASSHPQYQVINPGGSGGGIFGCDGVDGTGPSGAMQRGEGGKSDSGGTAYEEGLKGKLFYGGNQTYPGNLGSGGGGGYYGGGAGFCYGASGGGGSGYVSPLFSFPSLLRGNDSTPNFYTMRLGNGAIRITEITLCTAQAKNLIPFMFPFIYLVYLS
jgi:hypothetical protein